MKRIIFYTLLFFLITEISVFSDIPEGYYDTVKNLKGQELKKALYIIIKNHVRFDYSSSSTDVWDILKETDCDPQNFNNVILIYTGLSVNADQEYNEGKGWSREHIWSQSHGQFGRNKNKGAGTDVHHIRPVDIKVNTKKSNRFFDEGGNMYKLEDFETQNFFNDQKWTWEPRQSIKGDIARMIFYMAVRYEGENNEPDLELIHENTNINDKRPVYGKIVTLLIWHGQDPVDDLEIKRNDIIYEKYQKNRNPFIDHPEFAWLIWGNKIKIE